MEKEQFLKKYNIDEGEFNKTGLSWDELITIKNNYLEYRRKLEPSANYVAEMLRKIEKIHSVKTRLKNPEHLLEKIIRKKIEDSSLEINKEDYTEKITDLVGVRALHLFKEDWETIHQYITDTWDVKEKPVAYLRDGDPKEFVERFKERGCEIKEHPQGYRSIHYLVLTKPSKESIVAEIQVRTIFEEAWSEIDHQIRYPYDVKNPILSHYLTIFNRLAGSADEMGSFIKFLKKELDERNEKHKSEMEEQNKIVKALKAKIDELKIEAKEKEKLQKEIDSLRKKVISFELPYKIDWELPLDVKSFILKPIPDIFVTVPSEEKEKGKK